MVVDGGFLWQRIDGDGYGFDFEFFFGFLIVALNIGLLVILKTY